MKQFCLLLAFSLMLFSAEAFAQSKAFENVIKMNLRNSGSIIEDNNLKGYFFFYQIDQLSKKENSYVLKIIDENLNEIGSKNIIESKTFFLIEAGYNGSHIMLKFVDYKKKLLKFKAFDNTGKMTLDETQKITSKWDLLYYKQEIASGELMNTRLFDTPSGFAHYGYNKGKKLGYNISYLTTDGSKKWSYDSPSDSKKYEMATFASVDNDALLSIVLKRGSIFSKDFDTYIIGLDINTGSKLFEKELVDGEYMLQVSNAYLTNDKTKTILIGQYYDIKDKAMKDPSKGMFAATMDKTGNLKVLKYLSWAEDISKFLPVNAKGKMKGEGYFFFHKFIANDKGEIYAVAELYRKEVSAGAIAGNLVSGALGGKSEVSNLKMVIEDIAIFKFSPDFALEDIKIYDKSVTSIALPKGYGSMSTIFLGQYMKAKGFFDFEFTQISADKSIITAGYIDYEKRKGEKNSWVYGAISVSKEGNVSDKLDLKREGSFLRVFSAKFGYIMVLEYFKKEKKIDLRLEKINY